MCGEQRMYVQSLVKWFEEASSGGAHKARRLDWAELGSVSKI